MTDSSATLLALAAVLALVAVVIALGVFFWYAAALSRVFARRGVEPWRAWVPVLNEAEILRLGGRPAWAVVFFFIPVVAVYAVVLRALAAHRIGRTFGRGGGATLLAILLPPVWATVLASTREPGAAVAAVQVPSTPEVAGSPQTAGALASAYLATPPAVAETDTPTVADAPIRTPFMDAPLPEPAPSAVAPTPAAAPLPTPAPAPLPGPAAAPVPERAATPVPEPTATPVPGPAAAPVAAPLPAPLPEPAPAPLPEPAVDPTPALSTPVDDQLDDDVDETVVVAHAAPVVWVLVTDDGARHRLDAPVVVLGRRPAGEEAGVQYLAVPDTSRTLSKQHACLTLEDEVWTITDLHSTNGVFIEEGGVERQLEPGASATVSGRVVLGTLGATVEREETR